MTDRNFRTLCLMLFTLIPLLATGAGCSSGSAASTHEVVIPEQLMIDGVEWKRQEWTESVAKRVEAYFKKKPYLAENPNFQGEQACYANGSGKERCYWVLPSAETSQWIMLEFSGAQSSDPVEGMGEPFVEFRKLD